jgi:hypothetical protein
MSEQKISCEGFSSKWCFVGIGNQIVAKVLSRFAQLNQSKTYLFWNK